MSLRVLAVTVLVGWTGGGCAAPTGPRASLERSALLGEVDPYLNLDWSGSAAQDLAAYGGALAIGDVNGDGYGDVIVGAPAYDDGQVDEGAVFVYLGSTAGVDAAPAWTADADQAGAIFGMSVAAADVNGDGFDDVVVGAPHFASGQLYEGRVSVFHGSATGPSATASWTAEPNLAEVYFGTSVANAGDVDGDGFDDLIIGGPGFGVARPYEGRAYVYLGGAGGLGAAAAWRVDGNQDYASLGAAVAGAGDVNGDGYADVIVGAPGFTGSLDQSGAALVYHGSAAGLGAAAAWSVEGDEAYGSFGYAVGSAGDVNGDGYDDALAASYGDSDPHPYGGRVGLYLGATTGLAPAEGWSWQGETEEYLGYAVGAGDVDGDGYDDVLIGAPGVTDAASYEGMAAVFRGTPTGIDPYAAWRGLGGAPGAGFAGAFATGDVNGDGRSDVVIGDWSGTARAYLGGCVGSTADADADSVPDGCDGCPGVDDRVYDIDHDGACDPEVAGGAVDCGPTDLEVYPGAPERCDGLDSACDGSLPEDEVDSDGDGHSLCAGDYDEDPAAMFVRVWSAGGTGVEYGWSGVSVAGAGDVDGDGYDDVLVGSFDGASLYYGAASGVETAAGWSAPDGSVVASAGDVNADGYDDVLVAAPTYDGGENGEGRAALYLGGPSGPGSVAVWAAESNQFNANFGQSLGTAGDVDGDGYDDVVVGAPGFENGQAFEGRVFVYRGTATGLDPVPAWTAELDVAYAQFGASVGSAGDVNADGYADVAVGAYLYSDLEEGQGRVEVYLGSATGLGAAPAWAVDGGQPEVFLGSAVASAGDVNADGYDDLLVGGYFSSVIVAAGGEARVYLGSAAGLALLPTWTVYGDAFNGDFGFSAAGVGDTDGDGRSEIAVAAPFYDHGELDEGKVYVYRGTDGGPAPSAGWTAEGDAEGVYLGSSVSGAGDVNGDGLADLIVGGAGADGAVLDEGSAFVYLGRAAVDTDGDGVVDSIDACPGYDDALFDADGDGSCALALFLGVPPDCDDGNEAAHPGAPEVCDGLDNACAGTIPADELDLDLDGVSSCAGDCDDGDPARRPGAPEQCNGVDDACGGAVPADELDVDGDGVAACAGDCDDGDATVFPGAPELCDGRDDACAGAVPADEADADADGVRICAGDCDDASDSVHPGAFELCDGLDNTCAGAVPADEADVDEDGVRVCAGDCADDDATVRPGAPEVCDGRDNACAGAIPADEADADGDGVFTCAGDCDDADPAAYPEAPEVCDGADQDCDTVPDDGLTFNSWYPDADGDGFGDALSPGVSTCDGGPAGAVEDHTDCDDARADVFPAAHEVCDAVDNSCDGAIDEACEAGELLLPGGACGCDASGAGWSATLFGAALFLLRRRGR